MIRLNPDQSYYQHRSLCLKRPLWVSFLSPKHDSNRSFGKRLRVLSDLAAAIFSGHLPDSPKGVELMTGSGALWSGLLKHQNNLACSKKYQKLQVRLCTAEEDSWSRYKTNTNASSNGTTTQKVHWDNRFRMLSDKADLSLLKTKHGLELPQEVSDRSGSRSPVLRLSLAQRMLLLNTVPPAAQGQVSTGGFC